MSLTYFITDTAAQPKANRVPSFVAKRDVETKSAENLRGYSQMQRDFGSRLLTAVSKAYSGSKVYCNYRQKWIAVKVDKPTDEALESGHVSLLNDYCSLFGVGYSSTHTGSIIYRAKLDMLTHSHLDMLLRIAK